MEISICWLRRDLRLDDNSALWHALKFGYPVLPVFVFDTEIISSLAGDDKRLAFIYRTVVEMKAVLESAGSTLLVLHGNPVHVFKTLFDSYKVKAVFCAVDYEPYSKSRDSLVRGICMERGAGFFGFHDHVIFDPVLIVKPDGEPYHVFTPYSKKWLSRLDKVIDQHYPSECMLNGLLRHAPARMLTAGELNLDEVHTEFPPLNIDDQLIGNYHLTRDYPALNGTSRIGVHIRFGTISIRKLVRRANSLNNIFLNELIWREFYQMILYHYPDVVTRSFKPGYDRVEWLNRNEDFEAWCEGTTGYPFVDAGMRQLVQTGFMHNRLRMVTASFLTKHLLVDWRWGEAFFARHLLDYELASNNGGWQWAAGSGCDAAPYFRVFSPQRQQETFDPHGDYVRRWLPGYSSPEKYLNPIIDHSFARERAIAFLRNANKYSSGY